MLVPSLFKVGSFFISPDIIALQLLLEIAHCIPLSPQSVSSHLISSHVFSPYLSSCQLMTAYHNWSHLFSCLISSQLIWILLFFSFPQLPSILRSLSQLSSSPHFSCQVLSTHPISSYLSLSQPFSALRSSCQLVSRRLISSLLFPHMLSSSHIFSHLLSWSHLFWPHLSSAQPTVPKNLLQNRISVPKTWSTILTPF